MKRRAALLLLVACRSTNPRPSPPPVVALQAVDGGALVTVEGQSSGDGRPDGCPSRQSLALEALRLEAALRDRFGSGWNANVEESGVIIATPNTPFEEAADTSKRVYEAVTAAFPDVLLGDGTAGGHRGTILQCWPELVKKGVSARTRYAACLELSGVVVETVRVDRSRHLPAFAPLLTISEEEAETIASSHARNALRRRNVRAVNAQLVAECDASRRASSLVWIIDCDGDDYDGAPVVDAITVDAKTSAVVDTKTVVLGN